MKDFKELLNVFLCKSDLKEEEQFYKFFKSWKNIVDKIFYNYESKNNIFEHTNIRDIKNDVILIESDHSGWIQLLKTREKEILQIIKNEYKISNIKSISFLLKKLKD